MRCTPHRHSWSRVFVALVLALALSATANAGRPRLSQYATTPDATPVDERPSADPRGSGVQKIVCRTLNDAAIASYAAAAQIGGTVVRTSGTPSMRPLIQGVAFAVVKKEPYDSIKRSDLLVYMGRLDAGRPDRTCILHRAVERDRHGWLMSGDNNRWSESWDRVTPENYLGTVVMIFEPATSHEATGRIARR